jgi:hypothetical protein
MKLGSLVIGCLFVLVAACGNSGLVGVKPALEVEIVNQSSGDLENAEARFGDHVCRWGAVVKNASASYMYYPHPITTHAEVHWDAAGGHRIEKLDLSEIYPRGKSGRLTFAVYDDRVEVNFRKKP